MESHDPNNSKLKQTAHLANDVSQLPVKQKLNVTSFFRTTRCECIQSQGIQIDERKKKCISNSMTTSATNGARSQGCI